MPQILPFDAAMGHVSSAANRHLLLGNGFSIALKSDIFSYEFLTRMPIFPAPHICRVSLMHSERTISRLLFVT